MSRTICVKTRYYRARPVNNPGHEQEIFELPLEKTALVAMHCWNIGCPDGPAEDTSFCVGMGWPQATREAGRIMAETIRPVMDAARRTSMAVCHVESDWMDNQYPDVESHRQPPNPLHPHHQAMEDRAHGPKYLQESPLANMRRARVVSPQGNEPMVFYGDQLNAYLQKQKIETLFYCGFAADMCLLGAPGGARDMLSRGYRCILLRDATVGIETPQSFPERMNTRYAIHLFEWKIGFSIGSDQLIQRLGN